MNHLLMGKTALISKRPKRTSPVIQSATRANFDPSKKALRNRSNTVANLLPNKNLIQKNGSNALKSSDKRDESAKGIETLSWTQVKLEKRRQRFQRKMSEPVLASFQESSVDESSAAVDDNSVHLNNDRNASTERLNSSASSSSTELCDDHINDNLSDFASSPEVHRKHKPVDTSDQLSAKANNNNNYLEIKIKNKSELEPQVCSSLSDHNDHNEHNDRSDSDCKTSEQCSSADQCLIANNNCKCDKSSIDFEHRSEPITDNRDNRVKQEQRIDDNSNRKSETTDDTIDVTDTTDTTDTTIDTNTDTNIGNVTDAADAYSTIKREISELSLEECIQKLNQKLVSLNEDNVKH